MVTAGLYPKLAIYYVLRLFVLGTTYGLQWQQIIRIVEWSQTLIHPHLPCWPEYARSSRGRLLSRKP